MGDLANEVAAAALTDKQRLGKLAELLERSGIDIADIGKVDRVNVWQGFYKDPDGVAQTVDMAGITLSPSWAEGPKWPVVQPGPAIKLPASKVKPQVTDGWHRALVLPDMQIGYFRTDDGLVPTHDEAAIGVMLALVRQIRPSKIVMVGDNLDLPELSKYRHSPAFERTTTPAINRGTLLCAQLRDAAGPDCSIIWIAGNHEERLPNWLLDNARAAFGLRRGVLPDEKPDTWPVLSVPNLCRFDEFGVEYLPGYPASTHWINERLRVVHGHLVKSNGSTAHAYLAREKTSIIYGHVHRAEYAERTRIDHDGPRTMMAASPGCLARTDGVVPSTKGATDLDGRPIASQEDWQQGIALVEYEEGDGRFTYQRIRIDAGWARWDGKDFNAVGEN